VLDLSTIDHIAPKEVDQAIGEYHRVLRDGGQLLIVAWYSSIGHSYVPETNQHFFDWQTVQEPLARFELVSQQRLMDRHSNTYLHQTLVRKKPTTCGAGQPGRAFRP